MPEEEDQMRREDASMLTLHQLQDRVHLYTGREEASAAQRVRFVGFALEALAVLILNVERSILRA